MQKFKSLVVIGFSLLLAACSPHPATGVWKAQAQNPLGLDRIIVSFNGRANFTTTKPLQADWHCFWSGINKQQIELDCTPSTNPDQKQSYILTATLAGQAELKDGSKTLATLSLLDEDPRLKD